MNSPDTATFLEQLMRFRRRLDLVCFVRHLPIATALSIVATGAVALASHPTGGQGLIWFAAATCLALALAWIIALARRPSLARAAATLDRRFRLDDRTVTALEFARDSDSVSQLIVSDASARLAAHAPRELSLEFPRRIGWLSAGVVAVFVAVAVGRSPLSSLSSLSPDAGSSGRDSSAKTVNGPGGLTRPAPSPAPGDTEPRTGGAPSTRGLASEQAARAGQNESSPTVQAGPTLDSSAAQAKSSSDRSATSTAASEARSGAQSSAQGQRQGSSGAPTSNGAQPSGTGNARNGRGAGGDSPAAGLEAGTGGVNGAGRSRALPPLPPPQAQQPDADSSYAGRFRRAWNHAESPVAQERIPAARRAYVRDYFLAIRPNGQP